MKRVLTAALVLGLFAPIGLVGCGEESKVKEEPPTSTPGGTTTTTSESKVNQTGENPPAPANAGTTPAPK